MWDVHLSHQKLYGHMWAPHLSYATDVDVDGAGVVCSVTVPEHNNFPTLGNVANYISLEMALQQIAGESGSYIFQMSAIFWLG